MHLRLGVHIERTDSEGIGRWKYDPL